MTLVAIGIAGAGYFGAQATAGASKEQARVSGKGSELQYKLGLKQLGLGEKQFGLGKKRFEEEKRAKLLREQAYQNLISRGTAGERAGETQFLEETSAPPPELGALQESIARGGTQAQQQAGLRTNLAFSQAGVRGPEAAIGKSMQANVLTQQLQDKLNQLALGEAERRKEGRTRFFASKAGRGQAASLSRV